MNVNFFNDCKYVDWKFGGLVMVQSNHEFRVTLRHYKLGCLKLMVMPVVLLVIS